MIVVSEAEAAAIRAAFEQCGEFVAAVELRRLFPAITDTAQARVCARTIAGWKPLPVCRDARRSSNASRSRSGSASQPSTPATNRHENVPNASAQPRLEPHLRGRFSDGVPSEMIAN